MITNITVSDNVTTGTKGYIYIENPDEQGINLSMNNSTFSRNRNEVGDGGIYFENSDLLGDTLFTLNMTNITFNDNSAYEGSAIYIDSSVRLSDDCCMRSSTISGNSNSYRGTISLNFYHGIFEITESHFESNSGRASCFFLHSPSNTPE